MPTWAPAQYSTVDRNLLQVSTRSQLLQDVLQRWPMATESDTVAQLPLHIPCQALGIWLQHTQGTTHALNSESPDLSHDQTPGGPTGTTTSSSLVSSAAVARVSHAAADSPFQEARSSATSSSLAAHDAEADLMRKLCLLIQAADFLVDEETTATSASALAALIHKLLLHPETKAASTGALQQSLQGVPDHLLLTVLAQVPLPPTLPRLPPSLHPLAIRAHHPSADALRTLRIHNISPALLSPLCHTVTAAPRRRLVSALTAGRSGCSAPISALGPLCSALACLTRLTSLSLHACGPPNPVSPSATLQAQAARRVNVKRRTTGGPNLLPAATPSSAGSAGACGGSGVPGTPEATSAALSATLQQLPQLRELRINVQDPPGAAAVCEVVVAACRLPNLRVLHVPVSTLWQQRKRVVDTLLGASHLEQLSVDMFVIDTDAATHADVVARFVPLLSYVRKLKVLCFSGSDRWLQPLTASRAALTCIEDLSIFAGERPLSTKTPNFGPLETLLADLGPFGRTLRVLDVCLMSLSGWGTAVEYYGIINSMYELTELTSLRYVMFSKHGVIETVPSYSGVLQAVPQLRHLDSAEFRDLDDIIYNIYMPQLLHLETWVVHLCIPSAVERVRTLVLQLRQLRSLTVTGVRRRADRKALMRAAASLPACRHVCITRTTFWSLFCKAAYGRKRCEVSASIA